MTVSILHIIEAFGAGTLTALAGICRHTGAGVRHTVAHSIRQETPADYAALFPADTAFHKLDMRREIHPVHDGKEFFRVLAAIKSIRPDVVHCHSSKSGVLGRLAAWCANVPSVYTPHSYSFLQEGIPEVQKRFYRFAEMLVSRFGTAIAACSEHEYALAREIAGNAAWVTRIDNSLDMDELDAVEPLRRGGDLPVIGTGGRYVLQRNPELFGVLAQKLRATGRWVWIGADIRQHGLPEHVTATGWLRRADTLAEVAGLDIYLQTSLWEGLSYGILEAMALGKPVVASRIPANEAVVRHGVTGFLAGDADEFATHLAALAQSPELRETMGRAGKEYVRNHHDIRDAARRYAALYHDLAASRKPGGTERPTERA